MGRLQGLTGLYGPPADPNLTAGGTIDEGAYQAYDQSLQYKDAHGTPGDTANQQAAYGGAYSGQGTYGVNESGQITDFNDIPGYYVLRDPEAPLDETPSSHGGMYPRPMALAVMAQSGLDVVGDQARALHGTDQGGPRALLGRAPGGHEQNTAWSADRFDAPNQNALAHEVSGQLKAGNGPRGMADPDQGYGELNSLPEFQAGHSIRNVQHDSMPWDRSLTGPGGEEGTWLGRWASGTGPSFDGPDSPYGAAGNSQDLMVAEVRGYPTAYAQPVPPTVLPVAPGPQNDVWASSSYSGAF
jgi:hypothetical protein